MKKKLKKYIIGIDIGGTKVLTGLLGKQFRLRAQDKRAVNVHKGEKIFFRDITGSINEVLAEAKIKPSNLRAIGVGCPAMVDPVKGMVRLAPNISFLKNYPLREKLRKYYGVPVTVENDVNAGLYGEHQFGAARGFRHVAGIFLGTGVGGALILDNRLYYGATGSTGEIGHIFMTLPFGLTDDHSRCTLEGMTGRLAIASEAMLLVMRQKAPRLMDIAGQEARKIKSNALASSIARGDSAVEDLITAKARVLGIAMANVVNLLSPEVIVLGGGLMEAMEKCILPAAKKTMQQYAMKPLVKPVKVLAARLKDYAVVYGAAKLAYDSHKNKEGRE